MAKLRWGLIGCGDISRKRVAPALIELETCELVAVNRAQTDLAESFAREFGARSWYADWREVIADKDVDAVYIATPGIAAAISWKSKPSPPPKPESTCSAKSLWR
jgi:predicted dehydrogenase